LKSRYKSYNDFYLLIFVGIIFAKSPSCGYESAPAFQPRKRSTWLRCFGGRHGRAESLGESLTDLKLIYELSQNIIYIYTYIYIVNIYIIYYMLYVLCYILNIIYYILYTIYSQWIECLKLFLTFDDVRNICYIALRIAWETTFIYDFCLVPIYGFPPSHNSPIPIPNLHFSHFSASAGKHQGSICPGLSTPASFDVHVDRALL
jgi:hypothetical protein